MDYPDGKFSMFIHSLLTDKNGCDLSNCDTAIELGAGMGRFSYSLVEKFDKVYLVEPATDYADKLKSTFKQDSVTVFNGTAKDFIKQNTGIKDKIIFTFHLLHHLNQQERRDIFEFVKMTGSKAVFIEPNPHNPLIMLQIIFHPDMKVKEELAYLSLTKEQLTEELASCGLSRTRYFKLCFLPPFLTDLMLRSFLKRTLSGLEKLNGIAPFLGSYQAVYCESDGR